eukprot:scaffold94012_cov17-Phaeocystis_antarctica.AAC.1
MTACDPRSPPSRRSGPPGEGEGERVRVKGEGQRVRVRVRVRVRGSGRRRYGGCLAVVAVVGGVVQVVGLVHQQDAAHGLLDL